MTFYSALVRVEADTLESDVPNSVVSFMAPYEELSGDRSGKYLVFEDHTDEVVDAYRTDGHEYRTLEEFVTRQYQYQIHRGRFGFWHNPNSKWDTWRFLDEKLRRLTARIEYPVCCRIVEVDQEAVDRYIRDQLSLAWGRWTDVVALISTGRHVQDYVTRKWAKWLGLLTCVNEDEPDSSGTVISDPWETYTNKRVKDVAVVLDRVTFDTMFRLHFHPIMTYAYIDRSGWHAPCDVLWWGTDSSDQAARARYYEEFFTWLRSGNQEDWIAVVCCHI